MSLKSEKSIKIEHRVSYMLHRLDIQRLSGKKQSKSTVFPSPLSYTIILMSMLFNYLLGNRQVKTFEANLTMTEVSFLHVEIFTALHVMYTWKTEEGRGRE